MQDCEYDNSVLFSHIKDAVRKTANQAAADILVYDRIQLRGALNGGQSGIYAQKELGTQAGNLCFIPTIRLSQIELGLWADDERPFHALFCILSLTNSQGDPASGFW